MSTKPELHLSEQESIILRDISYARMRVLGAGEISSVVELPFHRKLTEFGARQAQYVLDFFRSAMAGNAEAVRLQSAAQKSMGPHAGGEYHDSVISDYRDLMNGFMRQGKYSFEDVFRFQNHVEGYVDIHNEVHLIPWQESWAYEFHVEKQGLIGILLADDYIVDVSHVGSTSVKGMIAKPIIDILLCPDDDVPLENLIPYLEQFGYRNLGECGRPGRYFLSSGDQPGETFYLHLCHKNHPVAQDQLQFQELLRNNKDIFSGYYELKIELANICAENRMMYREVKGLYINGVLSAYRAGKEN